MGYNYGAGNWERVEQAKRFALKLTSGFCAFVTIEIIVFSRNIIELFSKNDAFVMKVGQEALILNSIVFVTLGFQLVYGTFFLALGKSKQGGILSICRQGVFFIPLVLILSRIFGVQGVLFAQPIADIANVLLTGSFAYGINYRMQVN
ncbi:MATE family efflux transporter [Lacrimispora saccharolytica]|uniref:MATE family efflux transporter n=1 Tax=Lacrimispora saccharolytica TaxID=84030 RepID=UPI0002F24985|nr:MATE family efflux transporter [Lacrimispora saccharolytica]